MELSKRLRFIAKYIDKCNSIIDVGTDHGYIPIFAVTNNVCKKAIASDINKDPLKKAEFNAKMEGISDKIEVRLGGGLATLKNGEVDGIVIAGMGGNLIRDILESDKEKLPKCKFIILQPAQNPEVLREYLYNNNYEIIAEDLCYDEGIFYELFKVKVGKENVEVNDSMLYEISPIMIRDKNPLMKEYLLNKREKYSKILSFIKDDSEAAKKRKEELNIKIEKIDKLGEEI